jgi:PAS domain S-box-containing protein
MKLPYKLLKTADYNQLTFSYEKLQQDITHATNFIKAIESGNLDSEYEGNLAEEERASPLAEALLSMRGQMKEIAEKERERNWATEGLARFVEILRANNDNIETLYNNIIGSLVKYLGANQGGLFVINDEDEENQFIELVACYAFDRKKYLTKKLELGEGLVGQCVLEQEKIYMTEIPQSYMNITSGLGDANPSSLIIVPLKVNDKIYGVVEIASFRKFLPYQIEFIERLGESIASSIANAKVGSKTQRLLKESQMKEEQLRSQEEEMRQNMEELSATQEEMQRLLKDVQGKEKYLGELLNVSTDSIFTIDQDFKVISCNKTFSQGLEAMGLKIEKGFDLMSIFEDRDKERQKGYYKRAFAGESFELVDHTVVAGVDSYYAVNYAPLRDEKGQIDAVAVFARDVTEATIARQESEKHLKEAQQQAEELRSQEEEMRQNMEELQAIQEELARKNAEVEEIRKKEAERANSQIENQKVVMMKTLEKFKQSEQGYQSKIEALEEELATLKNNPQALV